MAFLAENGKAWLRRSKAKPKRTKPLHFQENAENTIQNGMGEGVFGLHRRARIVFPRNCGDVKLGRLKKGFGYNEKCLFAKKVQNWETRKRVWTAQARADRLAGRGMETAPPQPANTSGRRAKSI